ncbi:hypothetical protein HYH02_008940 [Chlamydomonas schloesseri]|uniref:Uncharacterized protein n=1 Tax=Chlamydomonas schloesseri TaxID=2026947 RepID=A0A836B235_9CHLO|nr:hypothetical protein HYH02_008940 [Chlamydomonas schloesseri]|eukprot:KAG2445073.1 hypothetical protein HYH02_008940 [Chlamydomonas schloesseri]
MRRYVADRLMPSWQRHAYDGLAADIEQGLRYIMKRLGKGRVLLIKEGSQVQATDVAGSDLDLVVRTLDVAGLLPKATRQQLYKTLLMWLKQRCGGRYLGAHCLPELSQQALTQRRKSAELRMTVRVPRCRSTTRGADHRACGACGGHGAGGEAACSACGCRGGYCGGGAGAARSSEREKDEAREEGDVTAAELSVDLLFEAASVAAPLTPMVPLTGRLGSEAERGVAATAIRFLKLLVKEADSLAPLPSYTLSALVMHVLLDCRLLEPEAPPAGTAGGQGGGGGNNGGGGCLQGGPAGGPPPPPSLSAAQAVYAVLDLFVATDSGENAGDGAAVLDARVSPHCEVPTGCLFDKGLFTNWHRRARQLMRHLSNLADVLLRREGHGQPVPLDRAAQLLSALISRVGGGGCGGAGGGAGAGRDGSGGASNDVDSGRTAAEADGDGEAAGSYAGSNDFERYEAGEEAGEDASSADGIGEESGLSGRGSDIGEGDVKPQQPQQPQQPQPVLLDDYLGYIRSDVEHRMTTRVHFDASDPAAAALSPDRLEAFAAALELRRTAAAAAVTPSATADTDAPASAAANAACDAGSTPQKEGAEPAAGRRTGGCGMDELEATKAAGNDGDSVDDAVFAAEDAGSDRGPSTASSATAAAAAPCAGGSGGGASPAAIEAPEPGARGGGHGSPRHDTGSANGGGSATAPASPAAAASGAAAAGDPDDWLPATHGSGPCASRPAADGSWLASFAARTKAQAMAAAAAHAAATSSRASSSSFSPDVLSSACPAASAATAAVTGGSCPGGSSSGSGSSGSGGAVLHCSGLPFPLAAMQAVSSRRAFVKLRGRGPGVSDVSGVGHGGGGRGSGLRPLPGTPVRKQLQEMDADVMTAASGRGRVPPSVGVAELVSGFPTGVNSVPGSGMRGGPSADATPHAAARGGPAATVGAGGGRQAPAAGDGDDRRQPQLAAPQLHAVVAQSWEQQAEQGLEECRRRLERRWRGGAAAGGAGRG